MVKVGDRVECRTDDCFDGVFGKVVEVPPQQVEARVLLDDHDASLWFFFSELRKVDA